MTMLEKIARASFAHWRKQMDELGKHMNSPREFENMPKREYDFAIANARAMLEAIEEPTQAMLDAALHNYLGYERQGPTKPVWNGKTMWQTMIRTALAEKSE